MTQAFGLITISFNSNGGSAVPNQHLFKGETVTRPGDPVKVRHLFNGWFEDNETFLLEWDFSTAPDEELVLHARWVELELIGIVVTRQPLKMEYFDGETLNLDGLELTLYYDSSFTETLPFSDFAARGITTMPVNGTALSATSHNGIPVSVFYNTFDANTDPLIVNTLGSVLITITIENIIDIDFTPPAILPLSRIAGDTLDVEIEPATITALTEADFNVNSIVWQIGSNVRVDINSDGINNIEQLRKFTIDASDVRYNNIGGHTLRLTIYKAGAPNVPYMVNIPFRIVE